MVIFVASLLLSFSFSVFGGCLEGSCGAGTCCSVGNPDEYLCCPLSSAVCCPDQRHCCPRGAECSPIGGGCLNKKVGLVPPAEGDQIADMEQANVEVIEEVEKLVNLERVGKLTKEEEQLDEKLAEDVKKEVLEEELVEEVKEEKLLEEVKEEKILEEVKEEKLFEDVKEERILKDAVKEFIPEIDEGADIVKCSDTFYCPIGNTCCFRRNGDYGCCPFIDGVCCPDGKHCCQSGLRCGASSEFCISPMVQPPWMMLRTQQLK